MTQTVLNHIFRIGKFLGITPPNTNFKKIGSFQKFYIILLIIFFILGDGAALFFRNFYLEDIHIKIMIQLLNDSAILLLNTVTILSLTFWKGTQLKKLLKLLQPTHFEKCQNFRFNRAGFLNFYLNLAATMANSGYVCYVHIRSENYFKGHAMIHVYNLYKAIYLSVLWEVYNVVLSRYKFLNGLLKRLIYKPNLIKPDSFLKKLKQTIVILTKAVDLFNEIFGWSVFLLMGYTCVKLIVHLETAFRLVSTRSEASMAVRSHLVVAFYHFLQTVSFIYQCDLVLLEAKRTGFLSSKLRWQFGENGRDNEDFDDFAKFVEEHQPSFSAAGFFEVDRSIILNILGTVTTFLIVFVQFATNIHLE